MDEIRFNQVKNGYDPEQVKSYIVQIQEAYQGLYKECMNQTELAAKYEEENKSLREENELLQLEIAIVPAAPTAVSAPNDCTLDTIGKILIDTRILAEKTISDAKQEAEGIVAVAKTTQFMVHESLNKTQTNIGTVTATIQGIANDLNKIMVGIEELYDENTGAVQPGVFGTTEVTRTDSGEPRKTSFSAVPVTAGSGSSDIFGRVVNK